ncbi:MAG: hypothetical protein PUF39_00275, partial [Prevotellaceae bacterium]|nr:hypothetical protein [Prevotellaceae bacterium]
MSIIRQRLLSLPFLIALLCPVCTVTYAAQTVDTMQKDGEESMAAVLKKIEKQTGYRVMFAYDDVKGMKAAQKVTSKDIRKALAEAIGDQPLTYTINGNFVSVTRKKGGSEKTAAVSNTVVLRGRVVDNYGD